MKNLSTRSLFKGKPKQKSKSSSQKRIMRHWKLALAILALGLLGGVMLGFFIFRNIEKDSFFSNVAITPKVERGVDSANIQQIVEKYRLKGREFERLNNNPLQLRNPYTLESQVTVNIEEDEVGVTQASSTATTTLEE